MWHIVAIGYLFVAVMYSAAQPSIARALIYLVFWVVLPTVFTVFAVTVRRRNRLMGQQEQADPNSSAHNGKKTAAQNPESLFRRHLIRYNPSVFHFGNTLFLKLMPTFAEGCLTIGAAYQVLCD